MPLYFSLGNKARPHLLKKKKKERERERKKERKREKKEEVIWLGCMYPLN